MKNFTIKMTIFLIAFFCSFSPVIIAQQTVSGRITDADDGTPVPGASIFIANTTIGTTSGEAGNYSLTVPGTGVFEVVISHVGYQSVFHKVDVPKDIHQHNVLLKTNEIQEVIISADKNYRRRDIDFFWHNILGETPSKKRLEVLNSEKVYYYLSSDNILTVSCREPIEIVNHQTGYFIRYVLQYFHHNYNNGETRLYGTPHYEELIPNNSRQKESWERKRQEVYAFSFNRFLRALYQQKILEEGFLLLKGTSKNSTMIFQKAEVR